MGKGSEAEIKTNEFQARKRIKITKTKKLNGRYFIS